MDRNPRRDNPYENRGNSSQERPTVIEYQKIGSFFEDKEKKIVKKELFRDIAKNIAKSIADFNARESNASVSRTQLRRIFDEVKRFEQNLNEGSFPYLRMIESKVSYAVTRAKRNAGRAVKAYDNLREFITDGLKLLEDEKDYHAFLSLFEAVYGFAYEHLNKN